MNPIFLTRECNKAILENKRIRITYKRERDGNIGSKLLEPYEVKEEPRGTSKVPIRYLYAEDYLDGPNRHIKKYILSNILSFALTDQDYDPKEEWSKPKANIAPKPKGD